MMYFRERSSAFSLEFYSLSCVGLILHHKNFKNPVIFRVADVVWWFDLDIIVTALFWVYSVQICVSFYTVFQNSVAVMVVIDGLVLV